MIAFCLLLLFAAPQATVDEADYFIRSGNDFYEAGNYDEAIIQYEKILDLGYENASLYYNIGNVYFKLGQIGKSILYYERAKKLSPRDEDIEFNLEIANFYVVDKIDVPDQFIVFKVVNAFKNFININTLSWIVLGLYVMTTTIIIIRILFRQRTIRRVSTLILIPIVTILAVLTLTLFSRLYDQSSISEGIIMAEKIEVLSSPVEDATELFSLHEGVKVRVEDRSGEWYKISLADGKVGWLDINLIEII